MGNTREPSVSRRQVETVGGLAVALSGVLWHFVYDWSGGNRVVAVLAPANESVWEHLKLVAVPMTVLCVVEMRWLGDWRRLWWSKVVGITAGCVFIVACFYTYTGAFGTGSVVAVDIASFFAAVGLAQWTSYRLLLAPGREVPLRVSMTLAALMMVGFGVLTFAPPHVPLFRQTSTGTYGPS
ncbi:MAG TPA: DUF6512 family protein [Mycobacteriales bacterium]|nr:DUF6512 family protein [Mycobacteriales bacterium]